MTGRHRFPGLTETLSPERRARIERRKIDLREDMALHELRRALGTSREALAAKPGTDGPAATRMELPADISISSLKSLIEEMGGTLEIRARFLQGDVMFTSHTEA